MILIPFIPFDSLIVLGMDLNHGRCVLSGARMIAMQGLYFDLLVPLLDEFRG